MTAVLCEKADGSFTRFIGTKAVVLATGDFSADRDMIARYCPMVANRIADEVYDTVDYDKEFVFGGLYHGDGQKMGLWAGAAWQRTYPNAPMGGTTTCAGPNCRPYANYWGLLVNRDGNRFMNEYTSSVIGGYTQALQPGSTSIAIWDSAYAKHPNFNSAQGTLGLVAPLTPEEILKTWEENAEGGTYVKADTLEELVEMIGLPVDQTLATIARYNDLCLSGADVDFGKTADKLYTIAEAPFFAHIATLETGMPVLTVMGGLRTNSEMQVCDADDVPLPGLYNVGTMVGDFYAGAYTFQEEGINYGACCITFGYLVGKHVARDE